MAAEDPYATVEEIDLADAGPMIAEGLREWDAAVRLDDDHAPDELDEDLRALVDQRVVLLPLGGDASLPRLLSEDEAASVADDFIEWPHGQHPLDAHHISETIISFASYRYDGDRPGTPA